MHCFAFGIIIAFMAGMSNAKSYQLCKTIESANCNNTIRKYYKNVPFVWNEGALNPSAKDLTSEGIVMGLIMLPSLFGNGALISMVIFENRFRTPTNLLVISQCIADLCMTFFVMLLSMVAVGQGGWKLNPIWCLLQVTLNRMVLFLTCVNFALLAIDRYIVIVKTKSTDRFTKKQILVACGLLWLIAIVLAFPWDMCFFPFEIWFEITSTFCYARYTMPGQKNSTMLTFARVIFFMIIPGLIMIFCFYHILGVVRTNRRKVGPSTVSNWRKIAVAVYAKSAYTSMAVLISFCLCILPYLAVYGLSLIGKTIHYQSMTAFKDIIYANTAIKPIIYITRSVPWSKKLRRLLNRKREVKKRAVVDSPAARRSSKYVVGNLPKKQSIILNSKTAAGGGSVKHFSSKDFHELFCVNGVRKAWDDAKC